MLRKSVVDNITMRMFSFKNLSLILVEIILVSGRKYTFEYIY